MNAKYGCHITLFTQCTDLFTPVMCFCQSNLREKSEMGEMTFTDPLREKRKSLQNKHTFFFNRYPNLYSPISLRRHKFSAHKALTQVKSPTQG
jgi:hypothetical protein